MHNPHSHVECTYVTYLSDLVATPLHVHDIVCNALFGHRPSNGPVGLLLIPMVDPEAVARCHAVGVGGQINGAWSLGGKVDYLNAPLELGTGEAKVLALAEPRMHNTRHRVLPRASLIAVGPSVRIAILESATGGINHPDLYTHLGLDISQVSHSVYQIHPIDLHHIQV